jgi:hypothetical protein
MGGECFLDMLGVVAEFRAARAELVGIAKAKRRGRSTSSLSD